MEEEKKNLIRMPINESIRPHEPRSSHFSRLKKTRLKQSARMIPTLISNYYHHYNRIDNISSLLLLLLTLLGNCHFLLVGAQESSSGPQLASFSAPFLSPSQPVAAAAAASLINSNLNSNPTVINNQQANSPLSSQLEQQQVALVSTTTTTTISNSNNNNLNKARYRTLYACEDRQLIIDCEHGYKIQLIRANFGRFSITQCNEQGHLDLSTDCMSPISQRVMRDKCQDKQRCSVNATSSIFGDRCPKTRKYLEVNFLCKPDQIEKVDLRELNFNQQQQQQQNLNRGALINSKQPALTETLILPANDYPDSGLVSPHLSNRQSASSSNFNTPPSKFIQPLNVMMPQPHLNQHLSSSMEEQPAPSDKATNNYLQNNNNLQQQQQQILTVINSEIVTQPQQQQLMNNNQDQGSMMSIDQQQRFGQANYVVSLRHLSQVNMSNPRCLFWDQRERQWLERAGQVLDSNATHTTCLFDSPGSYMLVMDRHQPLEQQLPLSSSSQLASSQLPGQSLGAAASSWSSQPTIQSQAQAQPQPQQQQQQFLPSQSLSSQSINLTGNSGASLISPSISNQQQQQSLTSYLVRFFSIFGYLLVILFACLALLAIAFVTSSGGTKLARSLLPVKRIGSKLLVGGSSSSSSPPAQLLTSSTHQGTLHHQTLHPHQTLHQHHHLGTSPRQHHHHLTHQNSLHHQQQQQQQHQFQQQQQLYTGTNASTTGTLSNLSGLGTQSNNYYYGLVPQQQQQFHQMITTTTPSSGAQQHLISPIVSSATSHRKSHLNLNLNLISNLNNNNNQNNNNSQQPPATPTSAGMLGSQQTAAAAVAYQQHDHLQQHQHQHQQLQHHHLLSSPSMRADHIYECVDDEAKKQHLMRSFYHLV